MEVMQIKFYIAATASIFTAGYGLSAAMQEINNPVEEIGIASILVGFTTAVIRWLYKRLQRQEDALKEVQEKMMQEKDAQIEYWKKQARQGGKV